MATSISTGVNHSAPQPRTAKSFSTRIQVVSDLHLEFYPRLPPLNELVVPSAGQLILAGDIVNAKSVNLLDEFFGQLRPHYQEIFYLPGNHEYYGGEAIAMERELANVCIKHEVIYLQREVWESSELVVMGCTLWSEIPEPKFRLMSSNLNDYRQIRLGAKLVTPLITTQWHQRDCQWLTTQLERYKDDHRLVIVATHHLPSFDLIHPDYQGSDINYGFASNLNHLVGLADFWVAGHTHSTMDVKVNGTRCVTNPRGYRHGDRIENSAYRVDQVYEI